jgi:uncharacterized protein (TIGR00251 family)
VSEASWLRQEGADLVLSLHIQPKAKRTEFAGLHGGAMKLRLAAPPVDGKANAVLCAFLADFCGVPKSAVTLLSGEASRAKRVRVAGVAPGVVERLLAEAAA